MGIWPGTSIWSVFQSISKNWLRTMVQYTACPETSSSVCTKTGSRRLFERPLPPSLRCRLGFPALPRRQRRLRLFPPRRPNPRSAHRRGGQRYVPEQRFRQNVKENASYGIILAHCPVHVFHPACSPRGMERGQYALVARLPSRGGLAGRRASCWMGGAHVDIPGFPIFFGAVAALLPIILSGGFHMDGFLDATDAIFSRRDRDRKLEIMKDPHCGPFAVLSCAALLLLELGAWGQWSPPRCFGLRVPPVFCPAVPRSRPEAAFPTPNPALSGFCLRDVLPRRSPLRGWRNMRSGSSF